MKFNTLKAELNPNCYLLSLLAHHIFHVSEIKFNNGDRQGRGKAIPLEAWTGTDSSRRLKLPDFETIDT